jgi:hypothetical protein
MSYKYLDVASSKAIEDFADFYRQQLNKLGEGLDCELCFLFIASLQMRGMMLIAEHKEGAARDMLMARMASTFTVESLTRTANSYRESIAERDKQAEPVRRSVKKGVN